MDRAHTTLAECVLLPLHSNLSEADSPSVPQPGQRQLELGGQSQGSSFDAQHDMILAMIDWVEKGKAPETIIASKYVGNDKRNGTAFERPLCVYPKEAVYVGGDQNKASSFECKYIG